MSRLRGVLALAPLGLGVVGLLQCGLDGPGTAVPDDGSAPPADATIDALDGTSPPDAGDSSVGSDGGVDASCVGIDASAESEELRRVRARLLRRRVQGRRVPARDRLDERGRGRARARRGEPLLAEPGQRRARRALSADGLRARGEHDVGAGVDAARARARHAERLLVDQRKPRSRGARDEKRSAHRRDRAEPVHARPGRRGRRVRLLDRAGNAHARGEGRRHPDDPLARTNRSARARQGDISGRRTTRCTRARRPIATP